ncbi:MAG: hypothetical protein R3211_03525 [Balneolaceae bacterium]|nr:hypothetical protein [Balneolaceae bacterium]
MADWKELIFSGDRSFEDLSEKVFRYQFENNPVYRIFCETLGVDASGVLMGLPPHYPIRGFKDTMVTCSDDQEPDMIFRSSGTSGMERSEHRVIDGELYQRSALQGFRHFYDLDNAVIWGYTPGYADNPDSSLIWMINELINQDESGLSRFLPLEEPLNRGEIEKVERSGRQLILFGAAFGLVDLVEMGSVQLPSDSIVIETGGMKTHRREITRKELHQRLSKRFGLDKSRIHSEYGMTELLSQAYATGGKWFRTVPWMKVTIRNPDDPMEELLAYQEGLIGVVDLANVHSCSFILTGDKGIMDRQGQFQVLGRWNPKDLRGCNFLVEED